MNKIGKKWMAADLYEKCLICDGKGRIKATQGSDEHNKELLSLLLSSPLCPECEGIGFMLIGMTVGELERLKAKVEMIDKATEAAALAKSPWIPVVGDLVRSKATGVIGTIERVFRGDPAGFQPNKVLVDVRHDHGGHSYNFETSDFEPINK